MIIERNGVKIWLTPEERRLAYEEQQHDYDLQDIENELELFKEDYEEQFDIYDRPVTDGEREEMANELRRIIDHDPDCTESQCRADAVHNILRKRREEA